MGLTQEEFEKEFTEYRVEHELPDPNWNVKPTQNITVLREDHKQPGVKLAEPARWALTPVWSKTLATRTPLFNARIETVLEKPRACLLNA